MAHTVPSENGEPAGLALHRAAWPESWRSRDRVGSRTVVDNRFVRELPGDDETALRPRQVHRALFSRVRPTPVAAPRLVAWSREVGTLLGIDETATRDPQFAQVFAGNVLLPGMDPYAANYGGHQFGQWAGQLGDGRAITLAEVVVNRQVSSLVVCPSQITTGRSVAAAVYSRSERTRDQYSSSGYRPLIPELT